MKKSFYVLLLCIFLMNCTITAQSLENNTAAKNAVYANVGSFLLYNSASLVYNRLIWGPDKGFFKNYYLNLEAGYFGLNSGFAPGPNTEGVVGNLGFIGLTGRNEKHFEIGLGISWNVETTIIDDDPREGNQTETFIWPDVTVGYRIQKENGLMFRVGIGFLRAVNMGVGYSF